MVVPRPGLAVTGRAPPKTRLTGDPETRFSFNLCREMLAPGGETAGDGRSVNARRDPSRDIVGVSHSPGPRVGLYFRLYISTWDPVLDRGVEMCKANVNREYVKITTPSQTYRLDCPIPCHVHQSI